MVQYNIIIYILTLIHIGIRFPGHDFRPYNEIKKDNIKQECSVSDTNVVKTNIRFKLSFFKTTLNKNVEANMDIKIILVSDGRAQCLLSPIINMKFIVD